jgi:major type 1 subunit fimbrin (pilin)
MSLLVASTPFLLRILPLASIAVVHHAQGQVLNPGDCFLIQNGVSKKVPCSIQDCTVTTTGGNFAVAAGAMAVPRDRVNGSVLKTIPQTTAYTVNCKGASDSDRTLNLVFALGLTQVGDTYPTGYAGLGIRYSIAGTACTPSTASSISDSKLVLRCTIAKGQTVALSFTTSVDLIKTGAIASGTLSTKPVVTVKQYFDGQAESTARSLTDLYSSVLTGTIAPQSCSVTMPAVVSLGNVPLAMFKGIGTVSTPAKPFQISVNCTGVDSKVFMTMSDPVNSSNRSNILTLESTTRGLGMQILRGASDTLVSFGPDSSEPENTNQFFLFNASATTPISVENFKVRYIQVGNNITAGPANGSVTATMSYQ